MKPDSAHGGSGVLFSNSNPPPSDHPQPPALDGAAASGATLHVGAQTYGFVLFPQANHKGCR